LFACFAVSDQVLAFGGVKMRIRNVMIVTALMSWPTPAQVQPAAASAARPSLIQQLHPVVDHVHVLMQSQDHYWLSVVGNVSIIEQSDGIVLVDSGSSAADGRRVVEHVRALSSKPVKAVVITHWHDDHPLGVSAILDAWPRARIIATANTKRDMLAQTSKRWPLKLEPERDAANRAAVHTAMEDFRRRAQDASRSAAIRQNYAVEAEAITEVASDTDGTYLVLPTEILNDRILIPDRKAPVEVMFLGRANTDGDAMVWMPKQRVFIAGDAVVSPVPYGAGGVHPAKWLATLKKIDAIPFAVLIPGHGSPQADHTYVRRLIYALQDVRSQVEKLDARNVPADQIRANMDFREQERRFVGDDEWRLRAFRQYWEQIADCAYRELKGQPIDLSTSCAPLKPT